MMAVYLTFATEAEALTALCDGDSQRYPGVETLNPCPMPVVSHTGEVNAEGAPIMTPVPGYHVNAVCRGDCPEALDQWRVYPATPFAVLA